MSAERDSALLELELATRTFREVYENVGVLNFRSYQDAKMRVWHALDRLDVLNDDGMGEGDFVVPSDPNLFGEPQDEAPLLEEV